MCFIRNSPHDGRVPPREDGPMINEGKLCADRSREIARELRCAAFKRAPFDFCRKAQLMALAAGF